MSPSIDFSSCSSSSGSALKMPKQPENTAPACLSLHSSSSSSSNNNNGNNCINNHSIDAFLNHWHSIHSYSRHAYGYDDIDQEQLDEDETLSDFEGNTHSHRISQHNYNHICSSTADCSPPPLTTSYSSPPQQATNNLLPQSSISSSQTSSPYSAPQCFDVINIPYLHNNPHGNPLLLKYDQLLSQPLQPAPTTSSLISLLMYGQPLHQEHCGLSDEETAALFDELIEMDAL